MIYFNNHVNFITFSPQVFKILESKSSCCCKTTLMCPLSNIFMVCRVSYTHPHTHPHTACQNDLGSFGSCILLVAQTTQPISLIIIPRHSYLLGQVRGCVSRVANKMWKFIMHTARQILPYRILLRDGAHKERGRERESKRTGVCACRAHTMNINYAFFCLCLLDLINFHISLFIFLFFFIFFSPLIQLPLSHSREREETEKE